MPQALNNHIPANELICGGVFQDCISSRLYVSLGHTIMMF